jgi:hypothetical protein
MGAMQKRRSNILFLLSFRERIGIDRSWNDKSSERQSRAIFLSFQTFEVAHIGDCHLSYLTWHNIEVPSMIILYLLGQTSAALHARPDASGFDRRFGGLVAGNGCTVVFFHRPAWSSSWLDSACPR